MGEINHQWPSDPKKTNSSNRDFINGASEGLQMQTDAHRRTWGLGKESSWDVDLNKGTLTFSFEEGKVVHTNIQVIGTYNSLDGTFMWGWNHPSIRENLAQYARLAKEWGTRFGEPTYTTSKINCSLEDVWKLSAVANRLANANGVYCGNANGTYVFMTMGTLEMSNLRPGSTE